MKSTLLASSALALVLSTGTVFAAGPTATITDAGNSNVNVIDQSAKQNSATSATIEQLSATDGGSLSTNAYIKQAGEGASTSKIKQHSGSGGFAWVDQSDVTADAASSVSIDQAGDGNESVVNQVGDGNTVVIRQGVGDTGLMSTNSGYASIAQNGKSNTATVQDVKGSGNEAFIGQTGDGNTATVNLMAASNNHAAVTQNNNNNSATTNQYGTNSFVDVLQTNNSNAAFTHQYGSDGDINIVQDGGENALVIQSGFGGKSVASLNQTGAGTSNDATITQISLSGLNTAYVYQYGENGTAGVTQVGGDLSAVITQYDTSKSATATVNQSGSTHAAYIYQANNDNAVAAVTQSGSGGTATINQ